MPDIFISYTHGDNVASPIDKLGWVELFEKSLEERLNAFGGRKVTLFRDPQIRGSDGLDDAIVASLQNSKVLLSVVSPGYLKSDWCKKEVDLFCDYASKSGGLTVGTGRRIVKVFKMPVDRTMVARVLPRVSDSIGHEFFQIDSQTSVPSELDPRLGVNEYKQFKDKLNRLAWDLLKLLDDLDRRRVASAPPPTGMVVYLAEASFDLRSQRDDLAEELIQFGHTVLPEGSLFPDTPDYASRVRENLHKAGLSVHLVGESSGIVPVGEKDRSVVELQYQIAGDELKSRSDFTRFTWLMPGATASDDRLTQFLDHLRDDENVKRTSLENLKSLVLDRLKPPPPPFAPPVAVDGDALWVYLVFDAADAEAAGPIKEFLFDQGYDVTIPLASDVESKVRTDHDQALQVCDSVLIYQGQAEESWRRTKLFDLKRAFGNGRQQRFKAAAVLLGDPPTPDKQGFKMHDVLVLSGFGKPAADVLEPYLKKLAGTQEQPA